jgi:hypothetical protein
LSYSVWVYSRQSLLSLRSCSYLRISDVLSYFQIINEDNQSFL